ncbi:MAG: hypothetical protein OXC95_08345 [Dehalococcoidia bacterium]|nr:hypothetical protein [Dehalococcoidia bacterium]
MTTQVEPIRGKVARILNSREVALNIGKEDGVAPGMFFDILVPDPDSVTDPDTGEVLGSLDIAKTRVKVIRIQDRLSVATTYRKQQVNMGGQGFLTRRMFEAPRWVTKYETLKTNESMAYRARELSEEDSYVSIGDPVVQVFLDEPE